MDEFDRIKGWQGQGPESIEERRRILRSLGAGGAMLGAPGIALATGRPYCKKDNKHYHPTASAVGSMMGSVTGSTPPMYGHGCSHYCSSSNWGSGWTSGSNGYNLTWYNCGDKGTTSNHRLRFWVLFKLADPGSTQPIIGKSCAYVLHDYPSSEEAIFLTALLNANKCGTRFPYTPKGVIDLYHNKNPMTGGNTVAGLREKAKTLFRDYLSQGNA